MCVGRDQRCELWCKDINLEIRISIPYIAKAEAKFDPLGQLSLYWR